MCRMVSDGLLRRSTCLSLFLQTHSLTHSLTQSGCGPTYQLIVALGEHGALRPEDGVVGRVQAQLVEEGHWPLRRVVEEEPYLYFKLAPASLGHFVRQAVQGCVYMYVCMCVCVYACACVCVCE
jgi:hypothetical protein